MTHSPIITFIGAGSTVFAKNLLVDILSFPELAHAEIRLFDLNPKRLETSEIVAQRVAQTLGVKPRISTTTDVKKALDGADYAINMIQVGGYEPCTVTDFEVPKKYGLRQTIADTLGIGGIMRGLRTIPVFLEYARVMEEVCPEVLHLNYVNPMAINCWAMNKATKIKTIGLCHSVQHTAYELSLDLGIPVAEIDYLVAGINHMAFYLKFEHNGENLYPRLHQIRKAGTMPKTNQVRYDMLGRLGYFVTESSEHLSEYVPYYIKERHPELIDALNIPLDEYPRRCVDQIEKWDSLRTSLEDPNQPIDVTRSVEYGSSIIHSQETGTPRVVYGNVQNHHLIDNLPEGCCVEVPCLIDKNGVQPVRVGSLPPHLAALMQTNINVQALTVEAALTGKKEHVYHAAMLDPHTSAELTLDEIWALVDDLLKAHEDWLPRDLVLS